MFLVRSLQCEVGLYENPSRLDHCTSQLKRKINSPLS